MMPDQTSAFIIFVHVRATFDLSHVRGLARIPFCRLADVFNVEGGKERSKHFHVSPPTAVAPSARTRNTTQIIASPVVPADASTE